MKYLIDKATEFNSDDGTLYYPASQDVIKLPLPASRLLEEFLTSEGRDLTREYLLETVWDNHGLQASGNNLNQYVSILRRNLTLLECHELIVTLPKVGFKLNTAVSVERMEDAPVVPPASGKPAITVTPVQLPSESRQIGLFLLSIIVLAGIFFGFRTYSGSDNDMTEILQADTGCKVIYLKDIADDDKGAFLHRVGNILKANNVQCGKNQVVIYNIEESTFSKNYHRTLLSICSLGKNKEIISCDNYYRYKWIKP